MSNAESEANTSLKQVYRNEDISKDDSIYCNDLMNLLILIFKIKKLSISMEQLQILRKQMSAPIRTIVMIKGANQYFLRTFIKSQMSLTRSRNFHGSKDASQIGFVVFSIFSISLFSFSSSSQWVISCRRMT